MKLEKELKIVCSVLELTNTKIQIVKTSDIEPKYTLYIVGSTGTVINHIVMTSAQARDFTVTS